MRGRPLRVSLLAGLELSRMRVARVGRRSHPVRRVPASHGRRRTVVVVSLVRVRRVVPVVVERRVTAGPAVHLEGLVDVAPRPVHVRPGVAGVLLVLLAPLGPDDAENHREEEQGVHEAEADDEAKHLKDWEVVEMGEFW